MRTSRRGFTLIEVSLVIAILVIILGVSLPFINIARVKSEVELAGSVCTQAIRTARLRSQVLEDDDQWGVHILPGEIIIFKGNSFLDRDELYDERTEINSYIQATGDTLYTFDPVSGALSHDAVTTFVGTTGYATDVSVSASGIIN